MKSVSLFKEMRGPEILPGYNHYPLHAPVVQTGPDGDIGIELECEGTFLPAHAIPIDDTGKYYWAPHADGSLRGESMEYTLNTALPYDMKDGAIDKLFETFRSRGTVLNVSNRTSVHVHINAKGMKVNTLCSFLALYATVEDVLVNWCGTFRVGNLFALRLSDSEWALHNIRRMFERGNFMNTFNNDQRYLACNIAALGKFGSIEFRSMRGLTDADEMKKWVDILWHLRQVAYEIEDPRDIIARFSDTGADGWLEFLFGRGLADELTKACEDEGVEAVGLLWDGVRRAQEIAYALPWDVVLPELAKEYIASPFIRKSKQPRGGINLHDPVREINLDELRRMAVNPAPARIVHDELDRLEEEEEEEFEPDMDDMEEEDEE